MSFRKVNPGCACLLSAWSLLQVGDVLDVLWHKKPIDSSQHGGRMHSMLIIWSKFPPDGICAICDTVTESKSVEAS